jgi:hypothetical protein
LLRLDPTKDLIKSLKAIDRVIYRGETVFKT